MPSEALKRHLNPKSKLQKVPYIRLAAYSCKVKLTEPHH